VVLTEPVKVLSEICAEEEECLHQPKLIEDGIER